MRLIGQGWSLVGLVACSLMLAVGCGKATDAPTTAQASSSHSSTTPVQAKVADRYASQVEAPVEPPLQHVQLPEIKQLPVPFVVVNTTHGSFKLQLDAERAPRTVYNFISYVNSGHYNNTIFHQVESGYAILGGGYTEDLQEKTGRYPIPNEAQNGLKNKRGTIAMARRLDDPNSATCQFILNLGDNPQLDHQGTEAEKFGFCVFGQVVEGQETLDKIAAVEVSDTPQFTKLPTKTVKIVSVHTMR